MSIYPIAPSQYFVAITTSDTANFRSSETTYLTKAIYVGGAGNFVAIRDDDTTVTFVGAVAGSVIPISCKRINSTSTTATNLVAMF